MLLLVALCLQAQLAEPQKTPDTSQVAMERVRRKLEIELPVIGTATERKLPTFRAYANEKLPPVAELWTDDTVRPLYVHTFWPLYHHEFLETVTPEELRAGVLYPIGIDVIGLVDQVVKGVRKGIRAQREAQARAAVQKELALLLEARQAADKDR